VAALRGEGLAYTASARGTYVAKLDGRTGQQLTPIRSAAAKDSTPKLRLGRYIRIFDHQKNTE
jgi:hypothetical protein